MQRILMQTVEAEAAKRYKQHIKMHHTSSQCVVYMWPVRNNLQLKCF